MNPTSKLKFGVTVSHMTNKYKLGLLPLSPITAIVIGVLSCGPGIPQVSLENEPQAVVFITLLGEDERTLEYIPEKFISHFSSFVQAKGFKVRVIPQKLIEEQYGKPGNPLQRLKHIQNKNTTSVDDYILILEMIIYQQFNDASSDNISMAFKYRMFLKNLKKQRLFSEEGKEKVLVNYADLAVESVLSKIEPELDNKLKFLVKQEVDAISSDKEFSKKTSDVAPKPEQNADPVYPNAEPVPSENIESGKPEQNKLPSPSQSPPPVQEANNKSEP